MPFIKMAYDGIKSEWVGGEDEKPWMQKGSDFTKRSYMFSWFLFLLLCERGIVVSERWLECIRSDRIIAAIKSPKHLEMFLQTELQVAFLQTGKH